MDISVDDRVAAPVGLKVRELSMRAVFVITALVALTSAVCPAWAGTTVFKCVDGDPGSLTIGGKSVSEIGDLACDGDGMRNGSCSFLSGCPACSVSTPPCRAPCFTEPRYLFAHVRSGQRKTLSVGQQTLIFRCSATSMRPHR